MPKADSLNKQNKQTPNGIDMDGKQFGISFLYFPFRNDCRKRFQVLVFSLYFEFLSLTHSPVRRNFEIISFELTIRG